MNTETRNTASRAVRHDLQPGTSKAQVMRGVVAMLLVAAVSALLVARLRSATQAIAAQPSLSAIGARTGQTAPDFTLVPVSGAGAHAIRLSDLRGQVVVINFWSPSCAPCRDEAPILTHAAQKYAGDGVVFLGVALESTPGDILSFARDHKIPYICGLDSTRGIAVAYGLLAIPVTVLVDRHGTVRRTIQGAVSASSLRKALQTTLNERG